MKDEERVKIQSYPDSPLPPAGAAAAPDSPETAADTTPSSSELSMADQSIASRICWFVMPLVLHEPLEYETKLAGHRSTGAKTHEASA
jgi:hypothetical protein